MSWLVNVANRLPAPVRDRLQRLRWRIDALGLPRLRWWTKARTLRSYGVSFRESPGPALRYALFDPELANFTYELGNREELAAFVGNAFDTTPVEVERHFQETEKDPELNERLQERLKRRRPEANPAVRAKAWLVRDRARFEAERDRRDGHPRRARFSAAPPGT